MTQEYIQGLLKLSEYIEKLTETENYPCTPTLLNKLFQLTGYISVLKYMKEESKSLVNIDTNKGSIDSARSVCTICNGILGFNHICPVYGVNNSGGSGVCMNCLEPLYPNHKCRGKGSK